MKADPSRVAAAAGGAGISAHEIATLLAVSEPAAWDILTQPHEVSQCLSLRELLLLSARLGVPALSLLADPPAVAREHRSFAQLAAKIRAYCAGHHLSVEQFGGLAGWEVRHFLVAPDSALDEWCLDALADICQILRLHWPEYLPDERENS